MDCTKCKQLEQLKEENAELRKENNLAFLLLETVASIAEDYKSKLPEQVVKQSDRNWELQFNMLLEKLSDSVKGTAGDGKVFGSDLAE